MSQAANRSDTGLNDDIGGNVGVTPRADCRDMRDWVKASAGWEPVIVCAALSVGFCVGTSLAALISLAM